MTLCLLHTRNMISKWKILRLLAFALCSERRSHLNLPSRFSEGNGFQTRIAFYMKYIFWKFQQSISAGFSFACSQVFFVTVLRAKFGWLEMISQTADSEKKTTWRLDPTGRSSFHSSSFCNAGSSRPMVQRRCGEIPRSTCYWTRLRLVLLRLLQEVFDQRRAHERFDDFEGLQLRLWSVWSPRKKRRIDLATEQ